MANQQFFADRHLPSDFCDLVDEEPTESEMKSFDNESQFTNYQREANEHEAALFARRSSLWSSFTADGQPTQPSSIWSKALTLGKAVTSKINDGVLMRDLEEAYNHSSVSKLSRRSVRSYWSRRQPRDAAIVLETVRSSSPESAMLKRCFLEVCALKMQDCERDQLLGSYGRDNLYKQVREEKKFMEWPEYARPSLVRYNLLKQRWYKVTETGHRDEVDALYQTIQKNPGVLMSLLK